MFIVLRGENIDFAKQQHLIRRLREDIGIRKNNSSESSHQNFGSSAVWVPKLFGIWIAFLIKGFYVKVVPHGLTSLFARRPKNPFPGQNFRTIGGTKAF